MAYSTANSADHRMNEQGHDEHERSFLTDVVPAILNVDGR